MVTWGAEPMFFCVQRFFFFRTSSVLPFFPFHLNSKAGASCLLYLVKADDGFDLRLDQLWASLRVNGDVGAPHLNVGLS